jgi:hypothetical protein
VLTAYLVLLLLPVVDMVELQQVVVHPLPAVQVVVVLILLDLELVAQPVHQVKVTQAETVLVLRQLLAAAAAAVLGQLALMEQVLLAVMVELVARHL